MFDRLSATACLAGTIPLAMLDVWILFVWVGLLTSWLVWDHCRGVCSGAKMADADIKRLAHALKEEMARIDPPHTQAGDTSQDTT